MMKNVTFYVLCLVAFLLITTGNAQELKSSSAMDKAHVILTNGKVYSLTWPVPDANGKPSRGAPFHQGVWKPDASVIAIRDHLIVAVGGQEVIQHWRGPQTEMIDLQQSTVVPGFVDSHTHIAELGEILTRINLTDVKTPLEAIERVRSHSVKKPKGEWIIGQGWDEGAWTNEYPDKSLLDNYFPEHPVVLKSLHGFAVWVNSVALNKLGIDSATPAPVGGTIVKNEHGQPTGILLNRATTLVLNHIPQPSQLEFTQWIQKGLRQMARDGFVSIHQAGASSEHVAAFQQLRDNHQLPIRVYSMLSARDEKLSNDWIKKGPYIDPEGLLDIRSVKAYYDGSLGSRGARLLDDYADKPGHRGVSGDGYGFNQQIVRDLMKAGFQVGIHAIGDAGNRETIELLASVLSEDKKLISLRHRIEHAQVIHHDDFAKFAKWNLIASMEPPHAVEDKPWAEQRLGKERIKGAYAWRTLRQHGVNITFNSDLPGSDHSIFYGLHAAVTRTSKDGLPQGGWYPEQALTIEEAVRSYTINSAYSAFREEQMGTIEEGKWADITIVKNDFFNQPKNQLMNNEVVMTIVGGKIRYRR